MMLRRVVLAAALACLAAPVVPLVVPPVITVAAVAAEKAAGKKAPEPEDPPGVVRMSVQAQQGAGIATRTAERRPVMEAVQAPGVVQFDERHVARLRPFVPGRALRLLAQPGDRVTRGQPLVEMDVPGLNDARDRVAAATASLHQAEAELAVALAAQRRGEVLSRDGSLSRAEAERRSAETARARASVETAQAQRASSQAQLTRLSPAPGGAPGIGTLVSPMDGVVVTVGANTGDILDPATDAFVIADLSQMLVIMQVSEKDVPTIHAGDPATIQLTSGSSRLWQGRVASLGAQLDGRTRTLPVRVELPNGDGALRAGLFVQVKVTSAQGREALEVPSSAIQMIEDKSVAFVRTGPETFERRDLQLGLQRPDVTEVTGGLRDNDAVVTAGAFAVKSVLQKSLLGSTD